MIYRHKATAFIIICLLMLFGGIGHAVSGQEYDASAGFKDGYNYSAGIIEGNVSVFVADELYNESIKLSYHIKDRDGNMLAFENERISLKDMNFPAEIPVRIDLNELFEKTDGGLVVAFDLVDEENIYWFADNPERNCDFEQVILDNKDFVYEEPVVETIIMHDAASIINDDDLIINAEVYFGSPDLYNEGVKLSYKIYNSDMELISGENDRYELSYDGERGTAQIQLHLSDLAGVSIKEELIICFDLVDEKNIYWFGDSPEVKLQSTPVIYKYDFLYNLKKQYKYIVFHQYIQVIINVAGIIVAAVMFARIRRRLKNN